MATSKSITLNGEPYIQLTSVFAGTVVALAITLILIPFGHGLGFSMDTPLTKEKANGMIVGIGLWLFFTQLISSALGGYFAGKTLNTINGASNHENEYRDGVHGLLSWGTSTILTAIGLAFATFLAHFAPVHVNPTNVDQDLARNAGIIFSFAIAAGSLVSAVAAWAFATLGGDHRNDGKDFSRHLSFKRKR